MFEQLGVMCLLWTYAGYSSGLGLVLCSRQFNSGVYSGFDVGAAVCT